MTRGLIGAAAVSLMLATAACSGNTGKGAAIGAAGGAGLGAVTGHGILGSAATGAIVGGASGFIYDQLKN
jgi:hypothetical protein